MMVSIEDREGSQHLEERQRVNEEISARTYTEWMSWWRQVGWTIVSNEDHPKKFGGKGITVERLRSRYQVSRYFRL
jgi:hypothetical protein